MQEFEQLGAFYLGKRYDLDRNTTTDELVLYDARDLTTHAVCLGMTGSGKTGLGIALLEEAAIDGIPSLVIDPKGDMGNLLLNFPGLAPLDFEPWIDPDEASRKRIDLHAYAEQVAAAWKEGLAQGGQDGNRVARLKDSVDMSIYTPGSTAGLPLTVLRSFDAPPQALRADAEALGERVQSSVSGLLALLGIDADPVQSRESILLANILQEAWKEGRSMDLAELIRAIQSPPFEHLGVLDLESFFPAKERAKLALTLNGLLASPSFARWLEGDPLDVGALLYGPDGRPRISILSIAHLSDAERMFFVTILLNEVVTWMRMQTGTSSLRALLYMDEIFGYFPPSAEPPSKRPMLTLLKQGRAFGLGVVLSTQNPVDLDYKGLSNAGTWFIGRLQTERDKARVLDGLEGVLTGSGEGFDRSELDRLLSSLGKRVFLMKNVHESEPVVFQTRWTLSYLRGPLGREHLQSLMKHRRQSAAANPTTSATTMDRPLATSRVASPVVLAEKGEDQRPLAPSGIEELFLMPSLPGHVLGQTELLYRPALYTSARLHFTRSGSSIDEWRSVFVLAPIEDELDWEQARCAEGGKGFGWSKEPLPQARFAALPARASNAKTYATWSKELLTFLYQKRCLTLWKSEKYRLTSTPGESESSFRGRLAQSVKERRDSELEKLRARYAPRLDRLSERIRKAEQQLKKQEQQYREQRTSSWISIGSSVLGAILGRKAASRSNARRAGSAARSASRASREKQDIERAEQDLAAARAQLEELEREFRVEVERLQQSHAAEHAALEEIVLRPRKGDIALEPLRLAWTPWRLDSAGRAEALF